MPKSTFKAYMCFELYYTINNTGRTTFDFFDSITLFGYIKH